MMILAPGQELAHRLRVGAAGVAVADIGREEFDEALLRTVAGGDDQGRRRPDGAIGNELDHQLRPRHHRATRCHAASKAMPLQRLGWSIRISLAFGVVFDSCVASMTGLAVDCFAASTTGPASPNS
jgi:hypothetical protein